MTGTISPRPAASRHLAYQLLEAIPRAEQIQLVAVPPHIEQHILGAVRMQELLRQSRTFPSLMEQDGRQRMKFSGRVNA